MVTTVTLGSTVGALQIGYMFAVFLFGIVTLQTYNYYRTFSDDQRLFKILVGVVWALELGHTIGVAYEVYRCTITLYGKTVAFLLVSGSRFEALGSVIAVGGALTLLVQLFFAMRVFKVLPYPYHFIGIFCMVIATVRFAGSIWLTYEALAASNLMAYQESSGWLITTLLVVAAATDVLIAVSMVYFLFNRRNSGLDKSVTLIDRLVKWTIRTGLITSIASISVVIVFRLLPDTFVWIALYTFLAKLYSNSLLSALHERQELRSTMSHIQVTPSDRRSKSRDTPRVGFNSPGPHQAISIEMKTTREFMADHDGHYLNDENKHGFSSGPSSPMIPSSPRPHRTTTAITPIQSSFYERSIAM